MTRIKLSDPFTSWPVIRQTPGSNGIWGDCKFFVNDEVPECDYWIVYEGLKTEESTRCPPQNIILITGEPPTVKRYSPGFLAQFSTVITCQTNINHPHVIRSQQSQPWHAGVIRMPKGENIAKLDYDYFQNLKEVHKTKLLSVICSSKSKTPGHRLRLQFVDRLKSHFGSSIDIFGRGFNPIPDKWDAIYPYKYHIALENCSIADYWTEKISDAFLAHAYPIYYGCTNLSNYFPEGSFTSISIDNPDQAISVIEELIKNKTYERSIEDIIDAKRLVLDRYNLFPMLAHICNEMEPISTSIETVVLKPESAFINPFLKVRHIFEYAKGVFQ